MKYNIERGGILPLLTSSKEIDTESFSGTRRYTNKLAAKVDGEWRSISGRWVLIPDIRNNGGYILFCEELGEILK